MVKQLLESNHMEFTEVNIQEDEEAKEFLIAQGHRTVPQLYKDDQLFVEGGYMGFTDYLNEKEK